MLSKTPAMISLTPLAEAEATMAATTAKKKAVLEFIFVVWGGWSEKEEVEELKMWIAVVGWKEKYVSPCFNLYKDRTVENLCLQLRKGGCPQREHNSVGGPELRALCRPLPQKANLFSLVMSCPIELLTMRDTNRGAEMKQTQWFCPYRGAEMKQTQCFCP